MKNHFQAAAIAVDHAAGEKNRAIFMRWLGPGERLLLALDEINPFNAALVAEISGESSAEAWRVALDLVMRRHPLLAAKIDFDAEARPFFTQVNNARIPLQVLEGMPGDEEDETWMEILRQELPRRFARDTAPLCRAVVVLHPRKAYLVFVTHHAIADGKALIFVLRDLMRAMAGETLADDAVPPSQEDLLMDVALQHVSPGNLPPPPPFQGKVGVASKPGHHAPVDRLMLSSDFTAQLRLRAQAERTTIHGALNAALVAAGRKRIHAWSGDVRILSPIDIRDRVQVEDACGNFISIGTVVAAPGLTDGFPGEFWDVARRLKEQLRPAESLDGILAAGAGIWQIVDSARDAEEVMGLCLHALGSEAVLSNLGVLPLAETYGQLSVQAVWGPWAMPREMGSSLIGVVTHNGRLSLTHSGDPSEGGLLKEMASVLIAAIA